MAAPTSEEALTLAQQTCAVQVDFAKNDLEHMQHKLWIAEQLNHRTTYLNKTLRRENQAWRARDAESGPASLRAKHAREALAAEESAKQRALQTAEDARRVAAHARERQSVAEGKLRIAIDEMEEMRNEILQLRKEAMAREEQHEAILERLQQEVSAAQDQAQRDARRLHMYRRGIAKVELALLENDEALQHKFKILRNYRAENPLPTHLLKDVWRKVCAKG
ncbi:Hypothetical Protein FCC1311_108652 [Hondaea fermentalgiana]|uniref:Uncharacterized protein n=1 Tax=Hondaea fermentalgiana TaxID=2315210 RepID=A0A2R5H0Q7_9STRA|nr:Hypothetical Protein FCC1311_108652 [Hondaea fermentalgiana]|eukprot:GBG34643.1 Hypothetical Protein FCC1311_108652 [Hondaea fermentalgiana]